MAITVRGKNIEITSALKDYVVKRVGKITKYFDSANMGEITAILTVNKGRHIVEVTVPINGIILRGEESTADMYASIDLVIEKLEKQIEKYKTKLSRKFKSGGFKTDLIPAATLAGEAAGEDEFNIVKTKRFAVKPMTVDEAVMQMNLIHHDFYVFTNADTDQVNVVYRRRDGQYGLIEPEF
ncbi:ribosome hibernation-promoting factor, HPF/YfiA family [Sporomusa carbonis]|uniref:ribosome hibernation-promoting factor, HPF/YfiA family n=1 Tax=Sporomusa carbonis TaxID=3076075 RepID=UPI003C7A65BF